jgi:hypothetical protein
MDADPEAGLLDRVIQTKDFFTSVLHEDRLADWNLAKDLGEFLIRIAPDEAIGHALVARAPRHLGDLDRAREALQRCRALPMGPGEAEVLLPLVAQEEKHLSPTG